MRARKSRRDGRWRRGIWRNVDKERKGKGEDGCITEEGERVGSEKGEDAEGSFGELRLTLGDVGFF